MAIAWLRRTLDGGAAVSPSRARNAEPTERMRDIRRFMKGTFDGQGGKHANDQIPPSLDRERRFGRFYLSRFGTRFLGVGEAAIARALSGRALPNGGRALLPALALRLTSHVGTPSCVNTNNISSSTSVQTAGLGHRAGSGCHSMSAMCFPYR
jgi:hypothetical protein